MSFKVEIKNVKEFTKFMEDKQKNVKEQISESVREGTFYLQGKVKESIARGTNAPVTVDTGRFLSSIDVEPTGKDEAKVFTDLEYAKFLEYGTSKMQARPHFANTAKVEKTNMKELFANKIKKI